MRSRTLLTSFLLLLLPALVARAQEIRESLPALRGEVAMTAKIWRDWKFRLPAETSREVGTAIDLGAALGTSFKAGLDGLTLLLDADGDGELETSVKGKAGFVVLQREGRRYAVRLEANPGWVFQPGSTMEGEIDGVRVALIDQNLNGRFDDFGADAMVLGRGRNASFLSRVVDLGGGRLVTLQPSADGSKLAWEAYDGPRGRIDLGYTTSGKVLNAVLLSSDRSVSVAVSGAAASVVLPTGDYRLHSGLLVLGGNQATVTTGRSRPVSVVADGSSALALGGPVHAEFAYGRKGDAYTFDPAAIWFYGKAGEQYEGWEPLGKSPKISILARKSGREIAQAYFPGSC
ncbi:MAG: hypothetical protein H6807_05005 [Planctomycetes bacterium]|nr:hypothetical protein [Planctomycetota bacterium]